MPGGAASHGAAPWDAIVLAGGASRRMGAAKAALPWGATSLLDHVVGVLGRAVDGRVVVSAAPGTPLPPTPSIRTERVERVDDPEPGRGPLRGLASGLSTLAELRGTAGTVFVAAVDLPLLTPELVRRVLALLDDAPSADVALPRIAGRSQPLAAAYRLRVAEEAVRRVAAGEGGFRGLLGAADVLEVDAALLLADPDLAAVDPMLAGFRDADLPEELARLRGVRRA